MVVCQRHVAMQMRVGLVGRLAWSVVVLVVLVVGVKVLVLMTTPVSGRSYPGRPA